MICSECGKKITEEAKFCIFCGHEFKSIKSELGEALLSLNISKTQTLILYDSFMMYKGERINYNNIWGVSYLLTKVKNSVNLIPTHNSTSFSVVFDANGKFFNIESSTTSFMYFKGEREKEVVELFGKLVYIIDNILKPYILSNLATKYERAGVLVLGDVSVNKEGLFRKRAWRKPEYLSWDQFYNSDLSQGYLRIFKHDAKSTYKLFASVPMNVMDAVLMPDFLAIEFRKNASPKAETGIESDSKDIKSIFCHSCAGPVEVGAKFCTHCGSKLM